MGIGYSSVEPVGLPEVEETIDAKINGFVAKDFEAGEETNGWRHTFFGLPWKKPANVPWKHIFQGFSQEEVKMHNARIMQEKSGLSKAEFFEKHGFVLCKAPTKVQNWNEDYENEDTDIAKIYHKEIDDLLRKELFPKSDIQSLGQMNAVLKRGPGSNTGRFYGSGVHQDYCLTPEEYIDAIKAYTFHGEDGGHYFQKFDREFRENFSESDVFSVVCFWRPVEMEEPLRHNPLCVLDHSSLDEKDMVKTKLFGFSPTGPPQPQLTLKYNESQRWCYYPDMTCDEVLVFKQFYFQKSNPDAPYKSCFHSAFSDPRQSSFDKQWRTSTEHRVSVFLK